MMAMMFEVQAEEQQREDRADARRGQGGQDRDRVDEALVEHAEDDVDGDERGQDQERLVGQRGLEGLARCPGSCPRTDGGKPISRSAAWMAVDGVAQSEAPRARLNDSVTAGNWPWWLDGERRACARRSA